MATDKRIFYIPHDPAESLEFDSGNGFAINPGAGTDAIHAFNVAERDVLLTAVGTGTIIVYGSIQENPPDFTIPSTIDNSYCPIMLADYTTPATYYAGGTGVSVAGTTKIVELNTNMVTWIAIHRSANTVDAKVTVTDNL